MNTKDKDLTMEDIKEILLDAKERGIIVGFTVYIPNGVISDFLIQK